MSDLESRIENLSLERGEPPQDCLIGDNGAIVTFESITVSPPVLVSSTFSKYHTYPISAVPNSTQAEITRRFSEFEWMYNQLVSTYPGVFIPTLPPKKTFGATSEQFIEITRRPALERFLNRISKIPILSESCVFQAFMTRHSFDVFQKEYSKKIVARSSHQLIKTYEYYFAQALQQSLSVDIEQDFAALAQYFQQKELQMTELANTANELQASATKQLKLLSKLTTSLTTAEKTDENLQFAPTNATRLSMIDITAQWAEQQQEIAPHYTTNIFQQYVYELEDLQTFQALCLAERKNWKYKADKSDKRSAAWNAPSSKCNTEKERAARANDEQQAEEDNKLLTYITKIIYFEEFQQLFAKNIEEYNANMVNFSQAQSSFAQLMYHNFEGFNNAAPQQQHE